MYALLNTPGRLTSVELCKIDEPVPGPDEALVAVWAFSLNRGELELLQTRSEGWQPGQDIAGVVVRAATDGFLELLLKNRELKVILCSQSVFATQPYYIAANDL